MTVCISQEIKFYFMSLLNSGYPLISVSNHSCLDCRSISPWHVVEYVTCELVIL